MCSFLFTNKEIEDLDYVNRYMEDRGPDSTNIVEVGDYTFIHNLLSISGEFTPQPFLNEERQIACVYNGEIYNAMEHYTSDGECIIPKYLQHGFFFPNMLDGEFAICLVDYANERIVLSSDVFATKPIWYAINGDKIGVATFESALLALGFTDVKKIPANTRMLLDMDTLEILDQGSVFKFDLRQYKTTFDDWNAVFAESIRKRTKGIREKVFIGLSSGYDSGSIACELRRQGIPYKAYSITGSENMPVLSGRHALIGDESEYELFTIDEYGPGRQSLTKYLIDNVEPFKNTIHSSSSDYNEYGMDIKDDHGAGSLVAVCTMAKRDDRKIYLSGSGADELFSDYGFGGTKKYSHSNFGGLFPDDLSTIFPWASFYGSSQETYIAKEEHVAGSFGLETRYPYLDKYVVQEFLSLTPELKNSKYKSVLYNYLIENNYPFCENEKIGF
jgi:asparagine synthetase B (glutamine-hydrolysing)|tara:strand:+ start:8929 stop:10263 length:1335 start_codon:yes stop_codon:yes gene_type:complete